MSVTTSASLAANATTVAGPTPRPTFVVRERRLPDFDAELIERWRHLERRSLEGNAFRSADFVLPALRHLYDQTSDRPADATSVETPFVLTVETDDAIVALGVFETSRGTRLRPYAHLQSWRCDYSLFDGLLVDADHARPAVTALFEWLKTQGRRWQGIAFDGRSADSALSALLESAAEAAGCGWSEESSIERACIDVCDAPNDPLAELYSKSRRKTLNRNRRRLESFGEVRWQFVRPVSGTEAADSVTAACRTFLRLEALGWKGEAGSALASDGNHATFCQDMATGFARDGRIVFGELHVNGEAVASSLNLLSGRTLFAFKIGWDPQFAECSPGTQSEVSLLSHIHGSLPDVNHVDGCAKPGSYVEEIWPWRQRLVSGIFTTTWTASLATGALSRIRQLRDLVRR